MQPGNIIRFSFPRSDLTVNVDAVTLKPALALAGWVAFKEVGAGQAMAMGDLILTEDEVGPVMRALQAAGIEQTALRNHVLNETPRVMYMHILAHGDPHMHMLTEEPRLFFMHFRANDDAVKLASGLRAALDRTASKK